MKALLLCALVLWPVSAGAMSTGIYDLVQNQEFSGSFSYNAALESTNPFTEWSFQYDWPNQVITGQEWQTQDSGYWYAPAQTIIVTNPENATLTFQLCDPICGNFPNSWGMNIYDNARLTRYSAGGFFTLREVEPIAEARVASVPEPNTLWLVGMGVLISLVAAGRYTSAMRP